VLSLVNNKTHALRVALESEKVSLSMRTSPANAAFSPPERVQEILDEIARIQKEIAFWEDARAYAAERLVTPMPDGAERRADQRKTARA